MDISPGPLEAQLLVPVATPPPAVPTAETVAGLFAGAAGTSSAAAGLGPEGFDHWRLNVGYDRVAAILRATPEICGSLNVPASYGYQADLSWVLLYEGERVSLIKPHWDAGSDWYTLDIGTFGEAGEAAPLLKLFTPEGLAGSKLDRAANRARRPEGIFTPVDEQLVDRLDRWRRELLRLSVARSWGDADEAVHTLFSQLFILRTVEDRGLVDDDLSLRQVRKAGATAATVAGLIGRAGGEIESELFAGTVVGGVPDDVVSQIVDDLYRPRGLPPGATEYNFRWIGADVLGSAYEKYLSRRFSDAWEATGGQGEFAFGGENRPLREESVRRRLGVYYTPRPLARFLAGECVRRIDDKLKAAAADGPMPKVADFACGSGAFLVLAVNMMLDRLEELAPGAGWEERLVEEGAVFGSDIDQRAVVLTRLALWLSLAERCGRLPLPRLADSVRQSDALADDVPGPGAGKLSVIVGNPPFGALLDPAERAGLIERFKTFSGRADRSFAFLERAVEASADGGLVGFVMPNRLLNATDAQALRDFLLANGKVEVVADFRDAPVFPEARAYVGAIVWRKAEAGATAPVEHPSRAIVAEKWNPEVGRGLPLLSRAEGTIDGEGARAFDVSLRPGGPWLLVSNFERRARVAVESAGVPLSEIAEVRQGIKTGANDIFILRAGGIDPADPLTECIPSDGVPVTIETALLRPVAFGADIKRFQLATDRYLLYPYDDGAAIEEEDLRERFPAVYRYLSGARELLEARSGVGTTSTPWYGLVRARDGDLLSQPKIVTRDLAKRPEFAADFAGGLLLVGGVAVVPHDAALVGPLCLYLNTPLCDWWTAFGASLFQRSYRKFEPGRIAEVPIPPALLDGHLLSDEFGIAAESLSGLDEYSGENIDRILRELTIRLIDDAGLNPDEADQLKAVLRLRGMS